MTTARWGALLILALAVGGWSGSVVGAPPGGVVAQSGGTSSSGASGVGDSGSSGGGDSGSSGGGSGGGGTDNGDGADGGSSEGAADSTVPPDVPEEAIADGEETDCGSSAGDRRCYVVEQVDGVEAVRVPDGQGGTRIVAIGDAPQVNLDSGASTSASSNVDVRVDVDVDTGDVIRVERRIDPARQFAIITLAALLGVFVGAAVLGTFLRFRNGPKAPNP